MTNSTHYGEIRTDIPVIVALFKKSKIHQGAKNGDKKCPLYVDPITYKSFESY